MKTKIFYFSSTGNSLVVARQIAAGLDNAEIVSISETVHGTINTKDADKIGIVFPVYCWGMPRIVIDFIKKLDISSNKYYFAVVTMGGMPGGTLLTTATMIKAKGGTLSAGFAIRMPGNCITLYGAAAELTQQKLFKKSEEKIKQIINIVKNTKTAKIEKSFFIFNWLSSMLYNFAMPHFPESDKKFFVEASCNSCGICEIICPVHNIKLIAGKPTWMHNCEQCLACIQWCPKQAIQAGKKTAQRKRYQHPGVSLKDFKLK